MKIGVDRLVGVIFAIILACSTAAWAADASPPTQAVADYVNTSALATKVTVTTSSAVLVSSALSKRRRILIQNVRATNTDSIYIKGASGATTNDWEIPLGSVFALDLGPGVTLYAISGSGSQDIRVLEGS